ncbi:5'/3'-nucleotidase SurE [Pedobacter sp. CFBP9032]|uniref:5'/3'-nucleotidase SurE n=1 Tax=Pedobacter sp. CFBP9032 TaxID=3096539 RepID=UPI002A6ADBFE|nr:5'/3'-nucleotidase SurE [Pedobacter sp. CFBP9032]MDY0906435.1 5'/3'-nucleotidase SurE [Pedobacter sp. CFBP9032]
MNILITNDDGIYSPGIAALAKIALRFGTVRVVAPDVEQSSMGHAITHSRPLSIKSSPITFENINSHRVNGTPADCVALGLHLYPDTQVVLSGINMGPNLGNSMWHSGTLAAAKQAVLLGVRGIALSTPVGKTEPDFEALDAYVEQVLKTLLDEDELALFNVNFPPEPKGIKWTRQSVRLYDGHVVPGIDPMERKHFWITVSALEAAEEDTDRWAVENDYVSITPLRLDLTNEAELEKRKHDQ